MKIIDVKELQIPQVKVIKYQRFRDNRGYFTETYRKGDLDIKPQTAFLKGVSFTQCNESASQKNVFRGLHFQWNPYMAKLIRLISGSMIDFALDIRKNSPTFGKIVGHKLESNKDQDFNEWVWIPVGFAHGVLFLEDSIMEYFCTGQWAPETERGISPLSQDIDWSLCNVDIKNTLDQIKGQLIISDKDLAGLNLGDWQNSVDSQNFIFENPSKPLS